MKLIFSFSFSHVILSALQNYLREFQKVYNKFTKACTGVWMASWEISKYFHNSIALSERNKLANSRKNIVPGLLKEEIKGKPWHQLLSSAQIKKKEAWAGDKKPVLE